MKSKFSFFAVFIVFGALIFSAQEGSLFSRQSADAAPAADNPPVISAQKIHEGIGGPLDMDFTGIEGDERIFATEFAGAIRITTVNYETPFLDITEKVEVDGEKGMLGSTFDPNYETNGYLYVFYTGPADDAGVFTSYLERYTVSDDPNFADKNSAMTILQFEQKSPYHNGGSLAFGPDGYLYLGVGDDSDNDSVQDLSSFNGKILRIDPNQSGGNAADCDQISGNYTVPADNPYVGTAEACSEIWSIGLRNPWRFTFDTETGDLYIGDVGDERTEELNFQAADSGGGANYGWPYFEGVECHDTNVTAEECNAFVGHTPPIFEYPHSSGGGSITGGYVYHGHRYPRMSGRYFFGDFTNSQVWSTRFVDGAWDTVDHENLTGVSLLSSFGQDPDGEVYAISFTNGTTGSIYRIVDEYGFEIDISAPVSVPQNEIFEYTLTITNVGSAIQNNLIVTNTVPADVTYVSGGTLNDSIVSLSIASLAAGDSTTVSWMGEATGDIGSEITNDAYGVFVAEMPSVTGQTAAVTMISDAIGGDNVIYGRLFLDANRDGIYDGEAGIEDISINIWKDAECDDSTNTAPGPNSDFVTTVTTAANGIYRYEVEDANICYFAQVNLASVPPGYVASPENVGVDDTVDSDFYSNGWTDMIRLPTEAVNGAFHDPTAPIPTATPVPTETPLPTQVPMPTSTPLPNTDSYLYLPSILR